MLQSQKINFGEAMGSLVDPEERMHDFVAEPVVLGNHVHDGDEIRLDLFEEESG